MNGQRKYPSGYTFIQTLGEGSFGRVDKAIRNDDEEMVAIKFQKKIGQDYDDDFEEETRNLKDFANKCENLVCIDDYGTFNKKHYIVMEFLNGKDMDKYYEKKLRTRDGMRRNTPLLENHMRDLVGAVKLMHKKGYAHSDIKPNNIIIERNGQLHLVDLGAACYGKDKKTCSTVHTKGFVPEDTYRYLSCFECRKDGDIFAIAAVMLYLLDRNAFERFEESNFKDKEIVKKVIDKQSSKYFRKVLSILLADSKKKRKSIFRTL